MLHIIIITLHTKLLKLSNNFVFFIYRKNVGFLRYKNLYQHVPDSNDINEWQLLNHHPPIEETIEWIGIKYKGFCFLDSVIHLHLYTSTKHCKQ